MEGILLYPVVTEKSRAAVRDNVFTFAVHQRATKSDVRRAVESAYKVDVVDVRMVRSARRPRRWMGRKGKMRDEKKALVKLKAGDTIQVFQI